MFSTRPRTSKYHLSYGNFHQADMNENIDPCIIGTSWAHGGMVWRANEYGARKCVFGGLEVIRHRLLHLLS